MKIHNLKDVAVKALPVSEQISVVQEVAGMTVSREFGYLPIVENTFFEKAVLEHCTEINLFEDQDFDIDQLTSFIIKNRQDVDRIIKAADPDGDLRNACHVAVQYRVNHGAGSSIDYLLESLARYLNTAGQQKIDPEAVQAVKNLVPLLQRMDSADVAKVIINHDKVVPINGATG